MNVLKRLHFFNVALLLTLALGSTAAAVRSTTRPSVPDFQSGELLVKFRGDLSASALQAEALKLGVPGANAQALGAAWLTQQGMQIKQQLDVLQVNRVGLPADLKPEIACTALQSSPLVEYAEPNYLRQAASPMASGPNDQGYQDSITIYYLNDSYTYITQAAQQWWIESIEADRCFAEHTLVSSQQIIIAICDTGIYINHPDLDGRLVAGQDFTGSNSDGNDDSIGWSLGHGSHVAGIAAALTNNSSLGVAGTAYLDCIKLMPIKVLDRYGSGSDWSISQGITWAADHGARVLNLSLAGTGKGLTLEKAIKYAYNKGCVVVAAAGNNAYPGAYPFNPIMYPAGFDTTLAVAACNSVGARTLYSEFQDYVDIAAPGGEDVYVYQSYYAQPEPRYQMLSLSNAQDYNNVLYDTMSGTSMAAPVVSGVAAMLLAQDPSRTPAEIENLITTTAVKTGSLANDADGWNKELGWGRVNLYRALKQTSSFKPKNSGRASYNYPNPFAPEEGEQTSIVIPLAPEDERKAVDLRIYDAAGRLVRSYHLDASEVWPGRIITWDGLNGKDQPVANGVYPYVLDLGGTLYHNKIAVLN